VRLAQLQAQIAAELSTAGRLSRAIEGFSGLPTADQKRQVDWVVDDATKTMQALNRVLTQ
jgi:DNA-binding SARP family transcriptional activator